MAKGIKLDHAGLGAVLKSEAMHRLVQGATEQIAEQVREQHITVERGREVPLPVESSVTTTDRAHGRVVLAHASGVAVQAKRGALTRAASAVGLEVHGD